MSENPVRKASEEAAKEFKSVAGFINPKTDAGTLADLIESHLAPVVAAAEEAMRDKCEAECEVIMQSREEGDAKGISAANLCAMAISLIPTGTALAEYVERATAELRAEMQPELDYLNNGWRERDEYIASLKAQRAARESIFKWLLGEEGDFPMRTETFGAYWWRPALRQRLAALSAPAKEGEK